MAETLGSLFDKLTIVKLKQWHCEDQNKSENLLLQEKQLQDEVNEYIENAFSGEIPAERLVFNANKIHNNNYQLTDNTDQTMGSFCAKLAEINCQLWHEMEKVYHFKDVPAQEKDQVVNQVAILNLERNNFIDQINQCFQLKISEMRNSI